MRGIDILFGVLLIMTHIFSSDRPKFQNIKDIIIRVLWTVHFLLCFCAVNTRFRLINSSAFIRCIFFRQMAKKRQTSLSIITKTSFCKIGPLWGMKLEFECFTEGWILDRPKLRVYYIRTMKENNSQKIYTYLLLNVQFFNQQNR